MTAEGTSAAARPRRGVSALLKAGEAASAVVGALLLAAVGSLFVLNTDFGRHLIEQQVDGLRVGPVGYLSIEGLEGDLWSRPTAREITLSDRDGVWLRARGVRLDWRAGALLARRVEAQALAADSVLILRRPVLLPSRKGGALPVSINLNAIRLELQTRPAFSGAEGRFRLSGNFNYNRNNTINTDLKLTSLIHSGDGLSARLSAGSKRPLQLSVQGFEAKGGAIAGSLGLDADRPFMLSAQADAKDGGGKGVLICTTGDAVVARGRAIWSAQGATANADLNLEASRLTRPLASHLGARATVTLNGAQTAASIYRVHAGLATDTLTVTLNGDINAKAKAVDKAMAVSVRSTDLSRGFSAPWAQSGRFDGLLRGGTKAWSLGGTVSIDGVRASDYALQQVRGPLSLDRTAKGLVAKALLTGTAGRGPGLLSSLLGAAPTAEARIERLSDGQWLLSQFHAAGAGLALDATGRRALLGGLVVEGKARLTRLDTARAGASGTVTANWNARKPDDEQPWIVTADASASALKTGMEALDHLLGAAPRLRAKGAFRAGQVTDARLELVGESLSAELRGGLAAGGVLNGAIDWRAKGPVPVGPLVIDGAAKGTGQVTGTLAAPLATLTAMFDQVDLPRLPLTGALFNLTLAHEAGAHEAGTQGSGGWNGYASLAASSAYGPVKAETGLQWLGDGLALTALKADGAGVVLAGDLSLARALPSRADLVLTVGPGVVLSGGRLEGRLKMSPDQAGAASSVDLVLRGDEAVLRGSGAVLTQGRMSAHGPLNQLDYTLEGRGRAMGVPMRMQGAGQANVQDADTVSVAFSGKGKVRDTEFATLEPLQVRLAQAQMSTLARLGVGMGEARLEARSAGPDLKVRFDLTQVDLGGLGADLAGKVDASLSLAGRGERLNGDFQARLTAARTADAPPSLGLDGWIKGRLDGSRLAIEAQASNGLGLKALTALDLPAKASAQPFRVALVRDQAMTGRVDVTGEIKPIWDLFFSGNQALAGLVDAHGTIGGTLGQPQFHGSADLTKGSLDDAASGLRLRDVTAQAEASADLVNVKALNANDGAGGTLSGEGHVGLAKGSPSSLTLSLKRFRLIDNELVEAMASGAATVTRGADGRATVSGDLTIDRADVAGDAHTTAAAVQLDVVERNRPVSETVSEKAAIPVPAVALDVRMRASRGIFVRGRGLDAEMAMDAQVTGTTASPVLSGKATIVRGDYDFAGKRFAFDDRGAVYLASRPDRIRLDLTATREDTNLTAVIVIKGTAAKPLITLTSTPALPNDEVLSEVLFGRSASQLSPLEAAQLASAVTGLATGGGLDVIGNLRSFARLDRLALGGGTTGSGVTVSGGKYVTDNVYLELTGGGREGPSAQVEWRVSRRLAIVSKLASQGDGKLSVRWRRDERRKVP